MLDAEMPRAIEEPVHGGAIEGAAATAAVRARDQNEQLYIHFRRKPTKCAIANLIAHFVP
jgi:hypothetical protein